MSGERRQAGEAVVESIVEAVVETVVEAIAKSVVVNALGAVGELVDKRRLVVEEIVINRRVERIIVGGRTSENGIIKSTRHIRVNAIFITVERCPARLAVVGSGWLSAFHNFVVNSGHFESSRLCAVHMNLIAEIDECAFFGQAVALQLRVGLRALQGAALVDAFVRFATQAGSKAELAFVFESVVRELFGGR